MFSIGATPDQLAIMTKAFDDYCQVHRIADEADRESIAFAVITLFDAGATTARKLEAALDRVGRIQQDNFADD